MKQPNEENKPFELNKQERDDVLLNDVFNHDVRQEQINEIFNEVMGIQNVINEYQLKLIFVSASMKNINKFLPYFNKYLPEYEITTPIRKQMFFAQIGHESGCLRYVEEIASGKAYEGRKDLGNTFPGDGVKYKGRGLIQITGRYNYKKISEDFNMNFIEFPYLLSEPEWAVRSACWFWKMRKLNEVCDTGDFRRLTRLINGGYNGWDRRVELYELAQKFIKD